ncbi:acyltransferase domain-containing protein [Buchnera aphidicola (Kurisakia onigurumii)]|uniref:acyltransferase domain-containing protein n=1 Tax=Buchnera aphidicola TaxID=9 RepID=UPI0031B6D2AC
MNFSMIFPGHSVIKCSSLKKLNLDNNIIKNTFDKASDYCNFNFWKLIKDENVHQAIKKKYFQIMIMISSVAIYNFWKKKIIKKPVFMLGHSVGEYSALVCSNSISFFDAISILKFRERIMYDTMKINSGIMQVVIGLKKKKIEKICSLLNKNNHVVSIASINSKNQIVISGKKSSVILASTMCKKYGAYRIITLPIKIASHCILMKNASFLLKNFLKNKNINLPKNVVINPVHVSQYNCIENIRKYLSKQLTSVIKWSDSINYIINKKITIFLEIGTSYILTHLNKEYKNIYTIPINNYKNFLYAKKKIYDKKYIL